MTDHLSTALQLTPLIERVHGAHHPELTRVRELTEYLGCATNADVKDDLFRELRDITDGYALPKGACEAFTVAYNALESAEKKHHSSRVKV